MSESSSAKKPREHGCWPLVRKREEEWTAENREMVAARATDLWEQIAYLSPSKIYRWRVRVWAEVEAIASILRDRILSMQISPDDKDQGWIFQAEATQTRLAAKLQADIIAYLKQEKQVGAPHENSVPWEDVDGC